MLTKRNTIDVSCLVCAVGECGVFNDRPYPVVNIIADQVALGKLGVETCLRAMFFCSHTPALSKGAS